MLYFEKWKNVTILAKKSNFQNVITQEVIEILSQFLVWCLILVYILFKNKNNIVDVILKFSLPTPSSSHENLLTCK